jgi:hypothetical protein
MTEVTQAAADTAAMRAEADQLKASVREDNRALYDRQRRAAQLEYEAALIDDAALCLAELTGSRGHLERLQQAASDARDAERAAEDRRDADKRHYEARLAEERKADEDPDATPEEQEDAGIRVRKAQRRLGASETALAAAVRAHQEAKGARDSWQAHVEELEREYAAAKRSAENPGTAPDLPGLVPGVSRISDMDQEGRELLTAAVVLTAMLAGSSGSRSQPAGRNRRTTNGEWAQQDPSGFRMIRRGTNVFAIPPSRP